LKQANNIQLKVCGLTTKENIESVLQCNPDFIGFIFYPLSPRYIVNMLNPAVIAAINQTKKVGVFVNEEKKYLLNCIKKYNLDFVQLHGNESVDYCTQIAKQIKIIKAFRIDDDFDFSLLTAYNNCCHYFLFDTNTKQYGGSGKKFNWKKLNEYTLLKPFFLSGGIDENSITEIIKIKSTLSTLMVVDINSCFEISPGIKDSTKIKLFKNKLL